MKKLIFNIWFVFSALVFAQDNQFKLELKYHENTTYVTEFDKSIKFKTRKKVDKETLKYFDSLGLEKVLKGSKQENYKVQVKTKYRDSSQSIISNIYVFDNTYLGKLNGEKSTEKTKFNTLNIKARIDNDNIIKVDEILVDGIKSKRINEFKNTIEKTKTVLIFPKHNVEIGYSFTFEYPIDYLINFKNDIPTFINCIATLKKVQRGIAYFEVKSDRDFSENNFQITINGTIKFDINRNFPISSYFKSSLSYTEVIGNHITIKHKYYELLKTKTEMN